MGDAARPAEGADTLDAAYREWLVGRYGDRVITTNPQATFYGEMRHAFVAGAAWQAARPALAPEGADDACTAAMDAKGMIGISTRAIYRDGWLAALAWRAAAPVAGGGDAEYDTPGVGHEGDLWSIPEMAGLAEEVHAAWRDGMDNQGREVASERRQWETLDPLDQGLDRYIAQRLLLFIRSCGTSGYAARPAPAAATEGEALSIALDALMERHVRADGTPYLKCLACACTSPMVAPGEQTHRATCAVTIALARVAAPVVGAPTVTTVFDGSPLPWRAETIEEDTDETFPGIEVVVFDANGDHVCDAMTTSIGEAIAALANAAMPVACGGSGRKPWAA